MSKFVGGTPVNIDTALTVVKRIEALPPGKCEYYSYAKTKNGDVFVIYNNRHELKAITFEYKEQPNEQGVMVKSLHKKLIGYADLRHNKKKKAMHVAYITVSKGFEGSGIGSQMLEYIESYAAIKKCDSVTLDCLQTFTDGEERVVYRGDREDRERLEILKKSGKPVIDKNKQFYVKNGFEIQKNREPQNDYLIPMVKTKVVYRKPKMKSIAGELNFKLSRNTHKQKIILEAKQETLIRRMFKKGKRREISSNFEVYNARQL